MPTPQAAFLGAHFGGIHHARNDVTVHVANLPVFSSWFQPSRSNRTHRITKVSLKKISGTAIAEFPMIVAYANAACISFIFSYQFRIKIITVSIRPSRSLKAVWPRPSLSNQSDIDSGGQCEY